MYERYKFNKCDEEMDKSTDSYAACLRSLAKTCDYGELEDSLIHDQLVIGIHNNSVRKIFAGQQTHSQVEIKGNAAE